MRAPDKLPEYDQNAGKNSQQQRCFKVIHACFLLFYDNFNRPI